MWHSRLFAIVCLIWCTGAIALPAADLDRAVPRIGEPFLASMTGLEPDWGVQLTTDDGVRVMAARDLVCWGHWRDQVGQAVCLVGRGGHLVAGLVSVAESELIVESRVWQRTHLPRHAVQGFVLHPSVDALERDRLCDRVASHRGPQDRVWLSNGDELTGRLLPSSGDGEANLFGLQSLQFQLPGASNSMALDTTNVVAFAFGTHGDVSDAVQRGAAYVAFRDGSCLLAQAAREHDALMELQLEKDVVLNTAKKTFYDEVTLVQPQTDDVLYLSSVEPASFRHVPYLDLSWPLMRNRSTVGGFLREGGNVYPLGLSMHSTARAVYQLPPDYRVFAAELALDESVGSEGSAIYRVLLELPANRNSAGGWRLLYESPVVQGQAAPLAVAIALQGARRIALVVDFADRADTLDRANWFNARLMK
jgi:hypothetical protein